jgi:hypothetical protein
MKIENFEKKIHDSVKILGWSKKQHGTFASCKLLADSKNVHGNFYRTLFGLLECYNKKIGFLNVD